jgi:hypothetical protein
MIDANRVNGMGESTRGLGKLGHANPWDYIYLSTISIRHGSPSRTHSYFFASQRLKLSQPIFAIIDKTIEAHELPEGRKLVKVKSVRGWAVAYFSKFQWMHGVHNEYPNIELGSDDLRVVYMSSNIRRNELVGLV